MTLPVCAPLETYQRAALLLSRDEFVAALPGVGALVRIDERGGRDEPVRWAWDVLYRDDDRDLGINDNSLSQRRPRNAVFETDDVTTTGPAQPPLPIPPAREQATTYVLPRGTGRLGRTAGTLTISERSISREHAMFVVDDSGILLSDLRSNNGTSVNGMPLQPGRPRSVRSGDVVSLADTQFLFLESGALYSHLPALCAR